MVSKGPDYNAYLFSASLEFKTVAENTKLVKNTDDVVSNKMTYHNKFGFTNLNHFLLERKKYCEDRFTFL